jgi:hypothetical protein
MILPRLGDHAIEFGVVELAFYRLGLRPGDGYQHGVQVAGDKLWPDRLQALKTAGRVVGKLPRGNQERLAVHDQLRGVALLLQVWSAGSGLRQAQTRRASGEKHPTEKHSTRSHV